MTTAGCYTAYDLTVRSAIAIPGATALEDDAAGPIDLEILDGPVPPDPAMHVDPPYGWADGVLRFDMPDFATYCCTATGITIDRAVAVDDAAVAAYLIATALPACLWLRDDIVLHACAAVLPGTSRAIAVAGPSGSGKSTVLRALMDMGASIVADDTLCLRGITGSGLPGGYFLGGGERSFHAVPVDHSQSSARLAGLLVLGLPRADDAPEFRRLTGIAAVEALLANRHRPRIPALIGREAAQLPRIAGLAAQIPVHAWRRRDGAEELTQAEIAFLSDLAGHG